MSMLLALAALTLAPSVALAGTGSDGADGADGAEIPEGVDAPAAAESAEAAPEGPAVAEEPPPADFGRTRGGKGRGGGGGEGRRGPPGPRGDGPQGEGGEGGRGEGPRGLWAHIRPFGLLQLWGTAYDMDKDPVADATGYGDPEDDVGFKVKRFRLGLEGGERGLDWSFIVGLTAPYDGFDEQDGAIEIVDAHLGYSWKGLGVKVGRDELPFSRDRMIASSEQTFTERGMIAEHISPGRELGATIWAQRWGAKLSLGVYNSGGTLYGDDNLGKTLLGRLEYTYGDADVYQTWGGSRKFAFGVGGGAFMTDDVSTSTKAVGADAIVRVAGLTVLVDAALADVSPTNTELGVPGVWAQTTRQGLTGQIGYGLGAFEPAVKVSLFDDSSVGGYTNLLAGLVWHGLMDDRGRDRLRVGAGYELRLEDADRTIPNDTVRLWIQGRP